MPIEPSLWDVFRTAPIPHFLESLAITFTFCVVQTIAIFGLRLDSWLHELANFLRHYEAATLAQRTPVHVVMATMFTLNLIVVVIARRHKEGHGYES